MNADFNIDGHKLMLHPKKGEEWLRTGDTYPIHVEIGATGRCDQHCIFCALDWVNNQEDINTEVMVNALENMGHHDVKSVMFGGEGEPLLHKDIGLFIQKSKEYGMDVALTTNGSHFDGIKRAQCLPYLSWIKFSVDAGDAQTYSEVHGTHPRNFEKLMATISESVKNRDENGLAVTIGTQFLMIPQTMNGAPHLAKELSNLGVDYLSIKPYSHHPKSKNNLEVSPREYNSLEKKIMPFGTDDFKVLFRKATIERISEGNKYPECYGLPFISLIDSRGNVIPCNLFYNMDGFSYGNLYENSFSEIWEGDKRKEVIKKLRQGGTKNCRAGCRCDVINRYLHRLKHPQGHDNFT